MISPSLPRRAADTVASTVLVVDGNETSRRFVELAVRGRIAVEAAHDAASALEILRLQPVDIVLCDTDLPDMNGLAFFRRLSRESRLRDIPFVFLSADRSVETKVAALRAGVDDYMVKPCAVEELIARAEALVTRQRRLRETSRHLFSLAGDLSVIALPDIIGIIEMGRRTGLLSIVTTNGSGRLHFEAGSLVHATYRNLSGEEAFHRLFRESVGQFEFAPNGAPPEEITIAGSVTGLVLEAARRFDTEAASTSFIRRNSTKPPPAAGLLDERLPPLSPSSALAAQLTTALQDPFALGELSVWNERDLERWTRSSAGRERFHVVMLADLPAGVAATLSVAGAPTERCILDSLSAERKAFGITFFLRHERVIDVVLADATDPTAFLSSLRRIPSALLVCPPHGNLLSVGAGPRAGFDRLIAELRPPAVVAVGGEALESSLARLEPFQRKTSRFRRVDGPFGAGADLRTLLVESIRLWADGSGSA